MSDLEAATLEFTRAFVIKVVDDCIAIAKETVPTADSIFPWALASPADMKAAIIKDMEEYKTGVELGVEIERAKAAS